MRISMQAKCSDMFSMNIDDDNGKDMLGYDGYDGYVPDFMPEVHYGDYVLLDIDVDSGKILNWPKDARERVAQFVKNFKDEREGTQ